MKTVLLLYVYPHHHGLVERLSDEMGKHGIFVDVLDLTGFSLYKRTKKKWPFAITLLQYFFINQRLIYRIFRKLCFKKVVKCLIDKYDIIDFHYYSPIVDDFVFYCAKKGKTYDITLWGSDLLRASNERRQQMRKGFQQAHHIKSMKSVLEELSVVYEGEYDIKAAYADFGNAEFEFIDNISQDRYLKIEKETYPTCKQSLVVTLGYNGSRHQNHFDMIEAVNQLSNEYKSIIHVIIPLTYGCTEEYVNDIENAVKETGVSFSIPTKYMNPEEIAVLRKKSSITVNIQNTDAFSLSLQEHLYCGNVMLIADWLRYPELNESGIFYLKVNKNNLHEILATVINNYAQYALECTYNREKIERIISWNHMSAIWAQLYNN